MAANLDRFEEWWDGRLEGLPLMYVVGRKDGAPGSVRAASPRDFWINQEFLFDNYFAQLKSNEYLLDAFPSMSADIGPGSLALYLGAEPEFAWDTVWYKPCMTDILDHPPFRFDPENRWWKTHCDILRYLKERANGAYRIDVPDLIENMDTLASLRGTEDLLYDMMDEPEAVKERIEQIDELYFQYYDHLQPLLQEADGSTSYTVFHIQGKGRVAKIQCDISAMLSPGQFREFVLPSLRKQTLRLDRSLYHLDGPDAIKHVPALMELDHLDALQWTCGAGQPDGCCERWFPIYDQVYAAGKSLWIQVYDGDVHQRIRNVENLMNRYSKQRIYLVFNTMPMRDADILVNHAVKHWD